MTYEKFCKRVLEMCADDEAVTRKTIAKTATGIILLIVELAVALGVLVSLVMASVAFLIAFIAGVALTMTMFDYISGDKEIYMRWSKIAKFWWVGIPLMAVLVGLVIVLL